MIIEIFTSRVLMIVGQRDFRLWIRAFCYGKMNDSFSMSISNNVVNVMCGKTAVGKTGD